MWKRRPPDLIIGPKEAPQTLRWHLFRWRGIQVALHRWVRSDSDRALHDHTAGNISILLTGCYTEVVREWNGYGGRHQQMDWRRLRLPFIPYYRRADTPHRVELTHGPLWTLWIRFKPWRDWGFYCLKGWVSWKDYVDQRNSGEVGQGCG